MKAVNNAFFKALGLWILLMTVFIALLLLTTKVWSEEEMSVYLVPEADIPVAVIDGVAQNGDTYWFNKKVGVSIEVLMPNTTVTVVGDGQVGGVSGGLQLLLLLPSDMACPSRFEEDVNLENGKVSFPTKWSSGEIRITVKTGDHQVEIILLSKGGIDTTKLTVYSYLPKPADAEFEIPSITSITTDDNPSFDGPVGFYFWLSWTGGKESINPAYPVSWGGCDGKLVPTWEMVGNQLTKTSRGVPTIYQTLGEYAPGRCWEIFPTLFGADGHPLDPNDGQLHLAIRGMVTGLVPSLAIASLPSPKPYQASAYWDGENWWWIQTPPM